MKLLTNDVLISFWDQFIVDGNLESLSKIYFHYYDHLFDYGMRITPDRHAVEDAIQTGFMNFIKGRKNLGKVNNLPGYLTSTFRRQLLSELKKQKQMVPSESVPEEEFDFFKNHELEISDKRTKENVFRLIHDCISNLTPKQREIIYLRFEREIPYETISEMLNISVDSCYKSVYRSINIIRTEVEKNLGKEAEIILFFLFGH